MQDGHAVNTRNPIGFVRARPALDSAVGLGHLGWPFHRGMSVRAKQVHNSSLEPALECPLVGRIGFLADFAHQLRMVFQRANALPSLEVLP